MHDELRYVLYDTGVLPGPAPQDSIDLADPRDACGLALEMLSFYGPLTPTRIEALLPSVPAELLQPDESFIHGLLVTDDANDYWCDAENFESLMRFQRAARRSAFEPQPASRLPVFWAALQGIATPTAAEHAAEVVEQLRMYPAAIQTWLDDLLPPRLRGFQPYQWDSLQGEHELRWIGTGERQITFGYPEDLLDARPTTAPVDIGPGFTDPNAGYTFNQVADALGTDTSGLSEAWWQAVWQGQLNADSIAPLRQGLTQSFAPAQVSPGRAARRRLARSTSGWTGTWHLVPPVIEERDPLTRLEADKERVRLILDRYGFINRDIVRRERLPAAGTAWRWRDAFRALRIMELAGEVSAGLFFNDLSAPQFINARALSLLQGNPAPAGCYWLSAQDPASPCGLGIDWPQLPQRRLGNYLVFSDGELALTVENRGKNLTYHVAPDDPAMSQINAVFEHLLSSGRARLPITTINGDNARTSPYRAGLEAGFTVSADHKSLYLETTF